MASYKEKGNKKTNLLSIYSFTKFTEHEHIGHKHDDDLYCKKIKIKKGKICRIWLGTAAKK